VKLKKVPKRWSFVEVAWNDSIRDTCGWLKAGEAVYTNTAAWLPHFTAGYLAYACKGYITVMQSKSSMQDKDAGTSQRLRRYVYSATMYYSH